MAAWISAGVGNVVLLFPEVGDGALEMEGRGVEVRRGPCYGGIIRVSLEGTIG